jgi:hypothetical protein
MSSYSERERRAFLAGYRKGYGAPYTTINDTVPIDAAMRSAGIEPVEEGDNEADSGR